MLAPMAVHKQEVSGTLGGGETAPPPPVRPIPK